MLKYFRIAWPVRKLNARKYMHNINDNAAQSLLSKEYLTQKNYCMKYLGMKYSQFKVAPLSNSGNKIQAKVLIATLTPCE